MQQKIKISAVNYLNSKPFIYGLEHSDIINEIDLQLDIPSVCAEKLLNKNVDLGLVPVAILPFLKNYHINSNYCIGAVGKVNSVMLYSDVELKHIKKIILDFHSRTSVKLVQVLANEYWKINPQFVSATENFTHKIENTTAAVVIGDRTFGMNKTFAYEYDLSEEWFKFTSLPFIFACWVSSDKLPIEFENRLNAAFSIGFNNIETIITSEQKSYGNSVDVKKYLQQSISYPLDEKKKNGLNLFLEKIKSL